MARADFIGQLKEMGLEPESVDQDRVIVPLVVPAGTHQDERVRLGFSGCNDFPLTPPGCLHVSPRLLPLNNQGGEHPYASVHESPFGADWQYWSRPVPNWVQGKRSARDVIAHVTRLLATL